MLEGKKGRMSFETIIKKGIFPKWFDGCARRRVGELGLRKKLFAKQAAGAISYPGMKYFVEKLGRDAWCESKNKKHFLIFK